MQDLSKFLQRKLWIFRILLTFSHNLLVNNNTTIYSTQTIATRGLYTNLRSFFVKSWPYVWLVFKSGFKSRAGYSGVCTVFVIVFLVQQEVVEPEYILIKVATDQLSCMKNVGTQISMIFTLNE